MAASVQTSDADFGRRSRLALTHPVTLAALGMLLLNDLVLKSLWSNPWTTGKLSDLAWVIFATPLLAWLLSLAVRDSLWGQRAAFIVAYIGLPLLYAAFNTFAPVHDAIIGGLSLLSGAESGSPLDPTDSLVIPVGLAVALWVWRRGGRDDNRERTGTLRQRIVLLAAVLAAVASVATSPGPAPTEGITVLAASDSGISGEKAVLAGSRSFYTYTAAVSTDGGFNWEPIHIPIERSDRLSQRSIETPRGRFEIGEYGIMYLSSDGSASVVYSTRHLKSGSSAWFQRHETPHLAPQVITTRPHGILYDSQTGNVIVAMGILGVVVGTPDGEWTPVAVGPFQPIDFSFTGKLSALPGLSVTFLATIVTLVPAVMTAFIALAGIVNRRDSASQPGNARRYVALAISVVALPIAAYQLANFSQPHDPFDTSLDPVEVWQTVQVIAVIVAIVLSVTSFGLCVHIFENLPFAARRSWIVATILAVLTMIAEIFLMFVVWLQIDVSTDFVVAGILVLVIATGVVLLLYLTSPRRSETEPS